jgi:hypothetical protein
MQGCMALQVSISSVESSEKSVSTHWIPKLLGDITCPGKQEQRESMSCCRLLDGGQHTLPEREAKVATMMMMMMMGETNLFA